MARYLAIDWDPPRLNVLAVGTAKGHARAEQSLSLALEDDLTPATAEGIGRKLRDALKTANIAAAPVLWSIGRDRVVLKELTVPPTAAHEEPTLVRFQAAKESTEPMADTVIDFTHIGSAEPNRPRQVLAVLARKGLIAAIRTVCTTAGLTLQAVAPRAFAVAGLLTRKAAATTPMRQAVLLPTAHGAEFLVYRGHELTWARTFPASANLTAEVQRTLMLLAGQSAGAEPVQRVLTPASVQLGTLAVPVEPLDPWLEGDVKPQTPDAFLAPLGLAEAAARPMLINLASPKEPKPPVDHSRRKKMLGLIAVGILLPAFVIGNWRYLANKRAQIQELQETKESLDQDWKNLEQDRRDVEGLKEWEETTVSWIDELYDIAARMPHAEGLRLTQVSAAPLPRRGKEKEKFVAQLTVHGVTNGDQDTLVTRFTSEIRKDKNHLRLAVSNVHGNEFTIKIDVTAQPGSKYTTVLTVPTGAKRPTEPTEPSAEVMTDPNAEDDLP